MPVLQGTVGLVPASVGTSPPGGVQQGRSSEIVMAPLHGDKYTATYNGVIYAASTAVAGVAPGTALSTTPPMALWNPPASGVNLVILKTRLGYVSGTLGAGTVVYAQAVQATKPTGGTQLTPVNGQLGNAKTGAGIPFQGSTLAGTPAILAPAFTMGTGATTVAVLNPPLFDDVEGEFIVTPGNVFVMQGVAGAGTTPLVLFGLTWSEFPV